MQVVNILGDDPRKEFVLFQFGTGPVRGFAVTLSIGIIASMFTAIVVTRLIFDYLMATRRIRTLSI